MTPINADPGSLEHVIQNHLRLVYSAALRQTRDAHLAEDVTQAVFILFMRKRHSIPVEHVAGWLIKAAYFTSKEAMRAARRRQYHEEQAVMNNPNHSTQASSELAEVLDRALSRLGTRSRTAVALRYLEGRPVVEVAQILGISTNAATKVIQRGVGKLRRIFSGTDCALTLTPAALTLALGEIAAQSSSLNIAHLAHILPTTAAVPAAGASALVHASGKLMLWAKIQTAAIVLGVGLAVIGIGVVSARQAGLMAHPLPSPPNQPRLQFRLVDPPNIAATQPSTLLIDPSHPSATLAVDKEILLDESMIASAEEISPQADQGYSVMVRFTPAGAQKLATITGQNIGRQLAIIFDGNLISAPSIRSQISGYAVITGNLSKAKADEIIAALNKHGPTIATQPTTGVVIRDFGYRLGPSIELRIAPSTNTNPASTFISLQRQRVILPPTGLTWNPQAPIPFNPIMDKWLQDNDIDLLLVAAEQKVRIFGIRANYVPAATSPETTTADIVESVMKKTSRWNVTFPETVAVPFDFYVKDYSEHFAVAELSENIQSHGSYLFHYRLIEPDPTRPQDEHLALSDSEFLYARTYSNPTRAGLRITVAGDRLRQFGKTDHYYTGGLFLNGQLLTIGWFDLADRSFNSDILSTIDATPQRAQAIARELNQATPDNGYKRFIRLYSLSPGQALRHIPPPFPPERKYAMWPMSISPNGLIICNFENGEPVAHRYTYPNPPYKLQIGPLADIVNNVAVLQNYEFVVDPSLLQIKLAGDFVVDPSAKPEAKLAALQQIIFNETGRKIQITKKMMKRSVIVALGHYDFTPLPESNHPDAVAITVTTTNMTHREQGSGSDSWQGMLDMIGDYIGIRVINMVENPPKSVKWANYASIWTTYNAAAQTSDPKQINALLQILTAQTNLDFKIETRDEPTYLINAAP